MDLYLWINLITFLVTVFLVWKIRKRKEYKYSTLDVSCMILNTVLILMIYPPLIVAGALLGIDRFATEPFLIFFESLAGGMGDLMPAISVASVGSSVILRRKEKRWLSFSVQFVGIVWFAISILLGKLSGSY